MFICNKCNRKFETPLIKKRKPVAEDIEVCPYCGGKDFKEIQEAILGKGMPMYGEETEFERMVRDFEAIENDSNKNVDEQEEIKEQEKLTTELVMQIANSAAAASPGKVRISDITREVSREVSSVNYEEVSKFVRNTLATEGWEVSPMESKTDEQEEVDPRELPGYEEEADEAYSAAVDELVSRIKEWVGNDVDEQSIRGVVEAFSMEGELADLAARVSELHNVTMEEMPADESKEVDETETDEKKKPPVCKKCKKAHWPFKKCAEAKVDEQQDVEKLKKLTRCPKCGGVKAKDEILCKKCFAKVVGESKQEESKTNKPFNLRDMWDLKESDVLGATDEQEEVKEDTKGFLPRGELQQLIDAWELIGQHDDDPHVRTMADEKAEELEMIILAGQEDEEEVPIPGGSDEDYRAAEENKEVDEQKSTLQKASDEELSDAMTSLNKVQHLSSAVTTAMDAISSEISRRGREKEEKD